MEYTVKHNLSSNGNLIFCNPLGYKSHMRLRIDELRKIRKLSVEALAEKMGISRTYLQALKSGKGDKRFNIDHFEAMLTIFDCSVHDLFADDRPGAKRILNENDKAAPHPSHVELMRECAQYIESAAEDAHINLSAEDSAEFSFRMFNLIVSSKKNGKEIQPSEELASIIIQKVA